MPTASMSQVRRFPSSTTSITNLSGGAHFDVAAGTLAYVPGTIGEADRDLVLGHARRAGDAGAPRPAAWASTSALSPDGTRVLRNNTVGTRDVWIEDLARGTSTRVTERGGELRRDLVAGRAVDRVRARGADQESLPPQPQRRCASTSG